MPDFSIEEKFHGPVIGLDEVGRGPLAGPVISCGCYFKNYRIQNEFSNFIRDSKKLSEKKREFSFKLLQNLKKEGLVDFHLGIANVKEIDNLNILEATKLSMKRVVDKFNLKSIGGYYPSNYEIDDLDILDLLEKKNFKVSLPIIKKDNQMNFYSWSRNDPLKINKFGIPEPVSSKIFYPDILLVPLVAYDNSLNRLGYGGGYYDRYIEKIEKIKKVTKIGLAFSFQKISSIPINQYDKKLDFIVTEKEILQ